MGKIQPPLSLGFNNCFPVWLCTRAAIIKCMPPISLLFTNPSEFLFRAERSTEHCQDAVQRRNWISGGIYPPFVMHRQSLINANQTQSCTWRKKPQCCNVMADVRKILEVLISALKTCRNKSKGWLQGQPHGKRCTPTFFIEPVGYQERGGCPGDDPRRYPWWKVQVSAKFSCVSLDINLEGSVRLLVSTKCPKILGGVKLHFWMVMTFLPSSFSLLFFALDFVLDGGLKRPRTMPCWPPEEF